MYAYTLKRYNVVIMVKGKISPGSGHEGPEGKLRYRSTTSLTSALDGGVWLTLLPRPLYPPGRRWMDRRTELDVCEKISPLLELVIDYCNVKYINWLYMWLKWCILQGLCLNQTHKQIMYVTLQQSVII
jgi:hypothetical protein